MAAAERMQEQQRAACEVALFENYLQVIVSVHKESWNPWDWRQIAAAAPPQPPVYAGRHEAAAKVALQTYEPSFTEKLLKQDGKRRQTLAEDVELARQRDQIDHQTALQQHQQAIAQWQWYNHVAQGVLSQHLDAYRAVLDYLSPFDELSELGIVVSLDEVQPGGIAVTCAVRDQEIVPTEERRLTAAGKLTVKSIPAGRYWELYQDHVCSCALRVAREIFGLLPVARVVVNVSTELLDASTGHKGPMTILGVNFVRPTFERLNLDMLDPSNAMTNFVHRMSFKKTKGFSAVSPLALAEGA
ncbi:hypothetical protein [Sorangium sp. So ce1000]|uniref:hypothetical protein n=1 Tax=Sorangium sp. So ce1000 TaxID=3133325 RepID=UPI003F61E556